MAERVRLDLAYHWAPTSRRQSIKRRGLVPGSPSRNGAWYPPFVCLSRDPSYGIASSEGQTGITPERMDLWMVNLAEIDTPREEFGWHDELRFYKRIRPRHLELLATRKER